MPWLETDGMREKERFVLEAMSRGEESFGSVCSRYGVSRKTGYKVLGRYRERDRLSDLEDRSRRPRSSPSQTAKELEDRVEELRKKHGWGARKLHRVLGREGIRLGRGTVHRILRRRGLVEAKPKSLAATRRFERSRCNELAQMDFKGPIDPSRGGRCYPLSLLDDRSRYSLGLFGLRSEDTEGVQRCVTEVFERSGVPDQMLMDHGHPWWSSTSGHGLTRLSVFLIEQEVDLIFSGIGHPQTQGKVERFHRTMKDWFRHHGWPRTFSACQRALEEFRTEYNEVRPHEALDLEVPASVYETSRRQYRPQPREWEYPPGSEVQRVCGAGCIWIEGRRWFVSHALPGKTVRRETYGNVELISFRQMLIREINRHTGRSQTVVKPYGHTGHEPSSPTLNEGSGATAHS